MQELANDNKDFRKTNEELLKTNQEFKSSNEELRKDNQELKALLIQLTESLRRDEMKSSQGATPEK